MKNAFWLAVYAGFPKVVELLVGYGADLNATYTEGVTALHMLLASGPELNMRPISDNMHQLKKVQSGEAYFNNRYIMYLLFHLVLCRFMMNFSTLTLEGLLKAMLQ